MQQMTFKQILHRDVFGVFLNRFEFADVHSINGKKCTVLFDDIENIEREKRMQSHMDGIYARQKFLYIASEDFGPLPAQGAAVSVDGKRYLVMDATDESGIYAITLEATRNR